MVCPWSLCSSKIRRVWNIHIINWKYMTWKWKVKMMQVKLKQRGDIQNYEKFTVCSNCRQLYAQQTGEGDLCAVVPRNNPAPRSKTTLWSLAANRRSAFHAVKSEIWTWNHQLYLTISCSKSNFVWRKKWYIECIGSNLVKNVSNCMSRWITATQRFLPILQM